MVVVWHAHQNVWRNPKGEWECRIQSVREYWIQSRLETIKIMYIVHWYQWIQRYFKQPSSSPHFFSRVWAVNMLKSRFFKNYCFVNVVSQKLFYLTEEEEEKKRQWIKEFQEKMACGNNWKKSGHFSITISPELHSLALHFGKKKKF